MRLIWAKKQASLLIAILFFSVILFSPIAKAEYNITSLTLSDAQNLIAKGQDNAQQLKVNICIAVVDPSGALISFVRMDNAPFGCIEDAIAKAKAAALYRVKTAINMRRVNGDEPSVLSMPHMETMGGGVPVTNNENVVGAVGVSGAATATEIKVAEAMTAGYGVVPTK